MKVRNAWITKQFWLVSAFCLIAMMALLFAVSDYADTASHSMQVAQNPPLVLFCCTQRGQCPLRQPQPAETTCYCTSPYGPIPGYAC
jgi:hypothetical protein